MSPEEYIKAREESFSVEKATEPQEGDQMRTDNNDGFTFYNGAWVSWSELPKDHKDFLPF